MNDAEEGYYANCYSTDVPSIDIDFNSVHDILAEDDTVWRAETQENDVGHEHACR